MVRIFALSASLILLAGFQEASASVYVDALDERDGIYYKSNETKPFSDLWRSYWWYECPLAAWQGTSYKDCPLSAEGTFKDGKKEGPHRSWGISGQLLDEELYKDGKKNGQGTYTFPDGEKYVGAFKDNKKSGQGTYTYPDGDKYVGEYKDSKRNGQGTFTQANGVKYVGTWKDDKEWNGNVYNTKNNIIVRFVHGERINQ